MGFLYLNFTNSSGLFPSAQLLFFQELEEQSKRSPFLGCRRGHSCLKSLGLFPQDGGPASADPGTSEPSPDSSVLKPQPGGRKTRGTYCSACWRWLGAAGSHGARIWDSVSKNIGVNPGPGPGRPTS